VTHVSLVPRRVTTASQIATSAAAMSAGPLRAPPGRSNSARNGASMVRSPAPNPRNRNPKYALNAALASQRSSSGRPVADVIRPRAAGTRLSADTLSPDDEDDR
jgi:hypothetical protein